MNSKKSTNSRITVDTPMSASMRGVIQLMTLLASSILCLQSLANSTHLVGFASNDLNPSQNSLSAGDTYMGGYGLWTTRGAANKVHDSLEANALCITTLVQSPSDGFCLLIVDSLGVPGPIIDAIKQQVSAQTGLTNQQLFIGATHTHAAPDLLRLWGGSPKAYKQQLIAQSARTLITAFKKRQPARLYYAKDKAQAFNRRGWGYTDDDLVILEAISQTNEVLGVFINFAAHPVISTSQNLALSGDYVHYLRRFMRSNHSPAVVFAVGAIGDTNPMQKRDSDMWASTQRYGEKLAKTALRSLKDKHSISAGVQVQRYHFTTLIDNNTLAIAQWLGIINDYSEGPPWRVQVSSKLGRITLGNEFEALSLPGEATTRLGLRLKKELQAPAKVILGLTGGSLGYFIPQDEWQTGRNDNYEESVSLGKQVAGQITELITQQ